MIGINLEGKTAIVTGASQGLGERTARMLHRAGATVAINYFPDSANQQQKQAQQIATELGERAFAVAADVRDTQQVEAMIQQTCERSDTSGVLDIVVNNAAVLRDRTMRKMSDGEWQDVLDTNLTGVFNVCRAAAPMMRESGSIVNMASISATVGFYGQANYAAAKAGVIAMTKVLSKELAGKQITVNAVAPGVVLTEMGKSIPENVRQQMIDQIPLRRFGEPDDIASAILFLCSDLSRYVTGQTLHVNGGWYA